MTRWEKLELFFRFERISGERQSKLGLSGWADRSEIMDGITGLVAVVTIFGMPTAVFAMYMFYRVRKLRSEERLAAIQRGVTVPMEADLSETARSRRNGILSIAAAVGYMLAFSIVAKYEPDAMIAAAFGAIPFTLGLGFLLDSFLIRRDAKAT